MKKFDPRKLIKLLPFEGSRAGLEQGSAGLLSTWKIKNNFTQKDLDKLINKAKQIYKLNSWLMAEVVQVNLSATDKIRLAVNEDSSLSQDPNDYIRLEVNYDFFHNTKNLWEKSQMAQKLYMCPKVREAIKSKNQPNAQKLSGIYIVRDHENIESAKFLTIILNISHLFGDGHTMYALFNMFDEDTEAYSLKVERQQNYINESIKTTNLVDKNGTDYRTAYRKKVILPLILKSFSRKNKDQYNMHYSVWKVNSDKIKEIKARYEDPVNNRYVSTNDVITSWFFNLNPKSDNVLMAVNLRSRLKEILDDKMAGNYLTLVPFRKDDITTPLACRKKLNYVFSKDPPGYIELPTLAEQRKYLYGLTTNWCSFYKPLKISNLKMINVFPHFVVSSSRIFGCNVAYEDGIVIFKMNDEEIGCSIITGSSKISEKLLDQQEILLEKLVPPFDVTK